MRELTRRYVVMAMATEAPFDFQDPDGPFVLKPWKDPAALAALRAYRDACYPELARDLDEWIGIIERGPVVRGDVGRRNEANRAAGAGPRPTPRAAPGARPSRPAAKRPAPSRPKGPKRGAGRPKRRRTGGR